MKKNIIKRIYQYLIDIGINKHISDEKIIKREYSKRCHKVLDLENPVTYNEKIQWLKLYDRKDIYTTMVDKFEAKKYVSNIIGNQYIIPTIGTYNSFKEIDFTKLPNQFVIKCTHDSGGIMICKDKAKFDVKKAKFKFNMIMKRNYYYRSREWPYKNVTPRIIIEKYMEDNELKELVDYKFFCFNGKVKLVLVCTNRNIDLEETWFDEKFNLLDLQEGNHKSRTDIKKPKTFEKMKKFAEILSKNNPHLRVDFYNINNHIYFGELTLYPAGGFEKFTPSEWDEKLGKLIELPSTKIKD